MKQFSAIIFIFLSLKICAQNSTQASTLPQMPKAVLQRLFDSCTLVDYTFFTLPFTISIDRPNDIRSSFRQVGVGKVTKKPECKTFAKVFYQIKGRIVMDADVYFSEGCTYFIYNIDGKPTYANPISTEGVSFYNQLIERANKSKNKKGS
jgi:hypothetical protein